MIEVVVCRDELHTLVSVFVDGVEVPGTVVRVVDPGRGWTRAGWVAQWRASVVGVSVAAGELVTEHYIWAGGAETVEAGASRGPE